MRSPHASRQGQDPEGGPSHPRSGPFALVPLLLPAERAGRIHSAHMAGDPAGEAWKTTVLRSLPKPGWLASPGPDDDVVVSTRIRHARNLAGYRFPRSAPPEELKQVQERIEKAALSLSIPLEVHRRLSEAERSHLVGTRLISHDFAPSELHCSLLLDGQRKVAMMVNEEDHLRLQVLSSGLSLDEAEACADSLVKELSARLTFMSHPQWGWLAASPANAGEARRRSVLAHLPAAELSGRLPGLEKSFETLGIVVRGVFGEASHPLGSFRQVSMTDGPMADFKGACRRLVDMEREARAELGPAEAARSAQAAASRLIASQSVSSADAIRELTLVRWARAVGAPGFSGSHREVDEWIALLELQGAADAKQAARLRAAELRGYLEA